MYGKILSADEFKNGLGEIRTLDLRHVKATTRPRALNDCFSDEKRKSPVLCPATSEFLAVFKCFSVQLKKFPK